MCTQHCDLVKSAEDPNTYLINDTADPLQQSLSGLLLDGLPPSASAAFAPRTGALLLCLRHDTMARCLMLAAHLLLHRTHVKPTPLPEVKLELETAQGCMECNPHSHWRFGRALNMRCCLQWQARRRAATW